MSDEYQDSWQLERFRLHCDRAEDREAVWRVYQSWLYQPGVDADSLLDIAKVVADRKLSQ